MCDSFGRDVQSDDRCVAMKRNSGCSGHVSIVEGSLCTDNAASLLSTRRTRWFAKPFSDKIPWIVLLTTWERMIVKVGILLQGTKVTAHLWAVENMLAAMVVQNVEALLTSEQEQDLKQQIVNLHLYFLEYYKKLLKNIIYWQFPRQVKNILWIIISIHDYHSVFD